MISSAYVFTLISLFQINNLPAHYEHSKDALTIANAITNAVNAEQDAPITDSLEHDAALMVVYAIYESGLRKCVSGDGGKSLGTFQLQGWPIEVACNPDEAARAWIRIAKNVQAMCSGNSKMTDLAGLASGYCNRGLKLVTHRYEKMWELIGLYNEREFATSIE
jgi:hypothetical protein